MRMTMVLMQDTVSVRNMPECKSNVLVEFFSS